MKPTRSKWWTKDHDSAWKRIKVALKHDWDQTNRNASAKEQDTNQEVDDIVKQTFGHGAWSHYNPEHPKWNQKLEAQLKKDWTDIYLSRADNWNEDREAIRHGWDYAESESGENQMRKAA